MPKAPLLEMSGGGAVAPAEAALLLPVLRGLLRLGWAHQMTPAAVEVPWHQKRIDLVVADERRLLTVELKVDKWRRAIEQAYVNRWAADEAWVALWHSYVTPDAVRRAADAQVGLMIVTRRTVYPMQYPGPPPRSSDLAVRDTLGARESRLRDLISSAIRHAA